MANYAINGFGRIGRMVLRAMNDDELKKVVAINDLTDNKTLAHLLKYDSSQGQFAREVSYDEGHIIVDGHKIHATAERDPANLPWGDWNADVILGARRVGNSSFAKIRSGNAALQNSFQKLISEEEIRRIR